MTCSCQLKAENFLDAILQVHATEDSLAANIWKIHLLSKWRPTPCVLDKITCCTAAMKKTPPVQAKVSLLGDAAWFSSDPSAGEAIVLTLCSLVSLFLHFRWAASRCSGCCMRGDSFWQWNCLLWTRRWRVEQILGFPSENYSYPIQHGGIKPKVGNVGLLHVFDHRYNYSYFTLTCA